jgi:hypothetical protein
LCNKPLQCLNCSIDNPSSHRSFENKLFRLRTDRRLPTDSLSSKNSSCSSHVRGSFKGEGRIRDDPKKLASLGCLIDQVRAEMMNDCDYSNHLLAKCQSFEPEPEEESDEGKKSERRQNVEDERGSIEKLFNFVKIPKSKKTVSFLCDDVDLDDDASLSSLNSASLPASTEYGGGSDRYGYTTSHRTVPRNSRDRNQDLRDPIEPIDQHHNHHHHHHHHHNRESSIKRGQFTRSLSNTEPPTDEKAGKLGMTVE